MPQIEISDANFKRLQKLARPLIDTPNSVVEMLIDHFEDVEGDDSSRSSKPSDVTLYGQGEIPPLTHTKLRKAVFAGAEVQRPNWASLMRVALEAALKRAGSITALQSMTDARIVEGEKRDEGYRPLGSLGLSYQGVDAIDAWRIVQGIAKKLGVGVEVIFEWRNKEGAAFPGEIGKLAWQSLPPPK